MEMTKPNLILKKAKIIQPSKIRATSKWEFIVAEGYRMICEQGIGEICERAGTHTHSLSLDLNPKAHS